MVEARVEKGIEYATSLGMASAKRAKTVPTSMSRIPQDLVHPKKKGKGKGGSRSGSPNRKSREEMAKIPCTYFQQGKCRRGDKCFYKHEVATAPQRIQSVQIALHQRRRPVQKLRHASSKDMHA